MNAVEKTNQLMKQAQEQRDLRTKAKANLETAEKRKAELEAEVTAKGFDPNNLDVAINQLEVEVHEKLVRAEQLLNGAGA